MKTAAEISQYIVHFYQEREEPITNLKVQKLLYYIQGWHLALFDRPAFDGDLQAWVHGPVNLSAYQMYRRYRWEPITDAAPEVKLSKALKSLVDEVLEVYGTESAWELERRTHNESPWLSARKGLSPDEESTEIISHASMKRFFKSLSKKAK